MRHYYHVCDHILRGNNVVSGVSGEHCSRPNKKSFKKFKEQAGAEMCQAHIKVRFGLVWLGLVLRGLVGLGFGLAWFGI